MTHVPSELIDAFGGCSALAKLFDITPPSVSEWRKTGIPKARLFSMRLLRPDLFEPAPMQSDATKDAV